MSEQLPKLDASSTEWLAHAHRAGLNSKFCTMPPKYFEVLKAWGYVEGTPTSTRLTGKGMTLAISNQAAEKAASKKKKK